jgi:hypothetical protein
MYPDRLNTEKEYGDALKNEAEGKGLVAVIGGYPQCIQDYALGTLIDTL